MRIISILLCLAFVFSLSACTDQTSSNENNFNDKILKAMISEKYPENLVGHSVKWNFTKFLIDRNGNIVERFEPTDMKNLKSIIQENI